MATGMLHTHHLMVVLFVLLYLIKTILLLSDKFDLLEKFRLKTRIAEMVISFGFLATGIYLMIQLPQINMLTIVKLSLVFLSIPIAVVGFKNKNKVLAALAFFLIVVSYSLGYKAKQAKAGSATVATVGKDIFTEKCALCHGTDGKLGMSGAKDLSVTALNHQGIVEIITNGKNAMASYKATLSAEQIEAVSAYIESDLKGK
jgi:mono/diheme cytochrome c family protein